MRLNITKFSFNLGRTIGAIVLMVLFEYQFNIDWWVTLMVHTAWHLDLKITWEKF